MLNFRIPHQNSHRKKITPRYEVTPNFQSLDFFFLYTSFRTLSPQKKKKQFSQTEYASKTTLQNFIKFPTQKMLLNCNDFHIKDPSILTPTLTQVPIKHDHFPVSKILQQRRYFAPVARVYIHFFPEIHASCVRIIICKCRSAGFIKPRIIVISNLQVSYDDGARDFTSALQRCLRDIKRDPMLVTPRCARTYRILHNKTVRPIPF